MHVAVFGATTEAGKSVVVKLIEQNHTVTVFEDDVNPFTNHPNIKVIQGDLKNQSDVARAVEGAEAVVSALGNWRMNAEAVSASAIRNVLPEMEQRGIWRIVVLASVVTRVEGDNFGFLERCIYRAYSMLLPRALRDSEDQVRFLLSSKVDWTVIRAPGIRKSGGKGSWKFVHNPPRPWQRVHAEDVAAAMVSELWEKRHLNQAPFIKSGK